MPFKKRAVRRKPYARRWKLRRLRKAKIPIIPATAFGATLIFGKSGGWSSPYEAVTKTGNPIGYGVQSFVRNLTGIQLGIPDTGYTGPTQWNAFATLNPFDFNEAVALKGLIWGSVASMALRWLGVNRKFTQVTRKIPILNKFSL